MKEKSLATLSNVFMITISMMNMWFLCTNYESGKHVKQYPLACDMSLSSLLIKIKKQFLLFPKDSLKIYYSEEPAINVTTEILSDVEASIQILDDQSSDGLPF